MNGYKIANTILLLALVAATMIAGRAWLSWPLAWKLVTALAAVVTSESAHGESHDFAAGELGNEAAMRVRTELRDWFER